MNKKQLLIVIILGLIIGGVGIHQYNQRQKPSADARMGVKLLGTNFDVNAVAFIRIQNKSNSMVLTKAGDAWVVKERGDYPANFGNIADLVSKLADLKVSKPVQAGPSRLEALQLVAPDKNGAGVLVEMKDASGKLMANLLLGAKNMREVKSGPMMEQGWPDGRYVMVDGKIETIALVSDALLQAEPKPQDWINKDFIKVEKIKMASVTGTNGSFSWTVNRETETNEWTLVMGNPGEKLDSNKCSPLNTLMQSPTMEDVVMDWKFDDVNKPVAVVKLETFDQFVYTIKTACKTNDDYYTQVTVSADLPKERVAGKDEKPEDKAKLDKEFKDKLTRLQNKLAAEKKYENRVFIVSKWSLDPILKERKDYLEEKKEEAKPAGMPPGMAPGMAPGMMPGLNPGTPNPK